MEQNTTKQIERARELLNTVNNAAMATVNVDGSPHNTPYFFMKSRDLKYVYWSSHPDSLHSQNVLRTGQVFIVLYDAIEQGGLYIQANNAHITEGNELIEALKVNNERRQAASKEPLDLDYYSGARPLRMYQATVQNFWVNGSMRNAEGHITQSSRAEIQREELLLG